VKRTLVVVLLALASVLLVMGVLGLLLPDTHAASVGVRLAVPIDRVWGAVSDVGALPTWCSDFHAVEPVTAANKGETWKVTGAWGDAEMTVELREPPQRMVTFFDAGTFSGTWTYQLAPAEGGGTHLLLAEEGTVTNPFVRTLMLLADPKESMRSYARDLADHFGVTVAWDPEP